MTVVTNTMSTTKEATVGHFGELDGLRGVAAFIVMFAHFFYFGFNMRVEDPTINLIASSPLSILLSGQYCVAVFFVLSGFVLAHATSKGRLGFGPLVVKRYVRLTIPLAASTLFAFILFYLGLGTDEYRAQVSTETFRYFPEGFAPSIWGWAYESALRVYVAGESKLNGVLWTMRIELIGSIVVFAIFRFINSRRIRIALNVAAAAAMFLFFDKDEAPQGLQLFCCGMVIYDLWPTTVRLRGSKYGNWIGSALIVFGLLEAGWWVKDPVLPSIGALFDALRPVVHISRYEAWQMGAIVTVAGVLISPWWARLLASRPVRFLGLISFPLYLTHASIEIMGTGHLLLWLRGALPVPAAVAVALIINIAVCIAVAVVFLRLVELPAVKLSNRVARWRPRGILAGSSPRANQAGHSSAEP